MKPLVIGLVFELRGGPVPAGAPPDADAEYEPESTVLALEAAIRRLGHRPLRLGGPRALLEAGGGAGLPRLDAVLNIAEGESGRNREAWAPVLLEMLDIPSLGSDALTLSLSLDKAWTQAVVGAAGVPTPGGRVLRGAEEAATCALPGDWPLFVKPRWEGTAKGITPASRVSDREALGREVERITRLYRQPALVEVFLDGPEYTVTVIGNEPPRALPPLQRALDAATRIGLHALEGKTGAELEACLPGALDPALDKRLAELALRAFAALECRDFARADFRLGRDGEPVFLEINPLPSFAPDGSFGILAELAGRPFDDLLAEVIAGGLERIGLA